jgi:hypothetical protein
MRYTIIALLLLGLTISAAAQVQMNIGAGYFGHTLTHPGVVLEAEIAGTNSPGVSLFGRTDLGGYTHPRHDAGIFLDMSFGMRREFKSGLFLEESIGLGVLESFVNSDGVYSVDDSGAVSAASRRNPLDLMPSISLGIGYNLTRHSSQSLLIWVRPKIFWQFPDRSISTTYVPVLQVGVTRAISIERD